MLLAMGQAVAGGMQQAAAALSFVGRIALAVGVCDYLRGRVKAPVFACVK